MSRFNKKNGKFNRNVSGGGQISVQDTFLRYISTNKTPITVFLVCGVRLQGIVTHFDAFSLLLRREGHSQLVFKHAISTIMPIDPIQILEESKPTDEESSSDNEEYDDDSDNDSKTDEEED